MQSSARVPISSHLMLVGLMVLMFSAAMAVIFSAPLIWWVVPTGAAAAVAVGATQKVRERRHRREHPELIDDELLD